VWDQEWQDTQDNAVEEALKEDPDYIRPKWHWELD